MAHVSQLLPCDGCGQLADPQHIAVRLRRLEWATRYRPIHIQALVLGGIAPQSNDEFLYSPDGPFDGEAHRVLHAVGVSTHGKNRESALTEFQKLGLMLIHVLECPLSPEHSGFEVQPLLENQLAAAVTRVRRSLKPKRVLLMSRTLQSVADRLRETDLGCPVHPAAGVLLTDSSPGDAEIQAFRAVLGISHVQTA